MRNGARLRPSAIRKMCRIAGVMHILPAACMATECVQLELVRSASGAAPGLPEPMIDDVLFKFGSCYGW